MAVHNSKYAVIAIWSHAQLMWLILFTNLVQVIFPETLHGQDTHTHIFYKKELEDWRYRIQLVYAVSFQLPWSADR